MPNHRLTVRRVQLYIDPRDAWVGAYVDPKAVYICPLPFVVIRWDRRTTLSKNGWATGLDVWKVLDDMLSNELRSGALANAQLWSLREAVRKELMDEILANFAGRSA